MWLQQALEAALRHALPLLDPVSRCALSAAGSPTPGAGMLLSGSPGRYGVSKHNGLVPLCLPSCTFPMMLQILWLSTIRRGSLSMRNAAAKPHWQRGWPPHWKLGAEYTACTWTVLSWQAMQPHLSTKPSACG